MWVLGWGVGVKRGRCKNETVCNQTQLFGSKTNFVSNAILMETVDSFFFNIVTHPGLVN